MQKGAGRGVPLHLHLRSTPCRVFMAEMARSKTRTLHLELKVPTPVAMPKINGTLIRAGGSGRRRLLRVPASMAVLPASGFPVPDRNQAQHHLPPLRCSDAVTKAPPAPCALAFRLSCPFSSQGSTSTAQPKLVCLRWQSSPPPDTHLLPSVVTVPEPSDR